MAKWPGALDERDMRRITQDPPMRRVSSLLQFFGKTRFEPVRPVLVDDAGLHELVGGLINLGQVFRGLVLLAGGDEFFIALQGLGEVLFPVEVMLPAPDALAEGVFGRFRYWHSALILTAIRLSGQARSGYNETAL